jgi:ribosomal protein S18 acetylase RimI-like enzyme
MNQRQGLPLYHLRGGTAEDRAACFALLQANMQPYFQSYGLSYSPEAFAEAWTQGCPALLWWQDRLAGYSLSLPEANHAFLHTVQIDSRHRLRGLGSLLMHHFAWQSWQLGYRQLRLVVYADNPAFQWYQRLGYRARGPIYVQTTLARSLPAAPGPFPEASLKANVIGLPWPSGLS